MFFRKSIISVLICSLMVSTMGLTINKLYCICVDELETSFFEIEDRCHQAEKSICKNSEKSCCTKSQHENKPCAEKDAKYLKLNTEFERPDNPGFPFVAPLPVNCILPAPVTVQKTSPYPPALFYADNSPPIYLLHCVFRC